MPKTETAAKKKSLWSFNWVGGGYNQVYAHTREEALKAGNAMCDGSDGRLKLTVNERTLCEVKDVDRFWKNYPLFD